MDDAAVIGAAIGSPMVGVDARRSRYSTSAPIDDLRIRHRDGSVSVAVRKDLAWDALLPAARATKARFVHEPAREIAVYRHLLPIAPAGPARCLGIVDEDAGRRWLLLERLDGHELFQIGEIEHWQAAAAWIARFHRCFAGRPTPPVEVPLLVHDAQWHTRWAERAVRAAAPADRADVEVVVGHLTDAIPRLVALPRTVVHGELYASNVLVDRARRPPRVSAIDWEMAAWSCGLVDLAALTAGPWTETRRRAIEEAYTAAAGRRADDGFQEELDLCRLALCVQWLGWSDAWTPPPEHRQDWLAAALALVERIPV